MPGVPACIGCTNAPEQPRWNPPHTSMRHLSARPGEPQPNLMNMYCRGLNYYNRVCGAHYTISILRRMLNAGLTLTKREARSNCSGSDGSSQGKGAMQHAWSCHNSTRSNPRPEAETCKRMRRLQPTIFVIALACYEWQYYCGWYETTDVTNVTFSRKLEPCTVAQPKPV